MCILCIIYVLGQKTKKNIVSVYSKTSSTHSFFKCFINFPDLTRFFLINTQPAFSFCQFNFKY